MLKFLSGIEGTVLSLTVFLQGLLEDIERMEMFYRRSYRQDFMEITQMKPLLSFAEKYAYDSVITSAFMRKRTELRRVGNEKSVKRLEHVAWVFNVPLDRQH